MAGEVSNVMERLLAGAQYLTELRASGLDSDQVREVNRVFRPIIVIHIICPFL